MKATHTWHVRINGLGRAFTVAPTGWITASIMRLRGWSPFNDYWWSKPSKYTEFIRKCEGWTEE